jgi:hypothetical protein
LYSFCIRFFLQVFDKNEYLIIIFVFCSKVFVCIRKKRILDTQYSLFLDYSFECKYSNTIIVFVLIRVFGIILIYIRFVFDKKKKNEFFPISIRFVFVLYSKEKKKNEFFQVSIRFVFVFFSDYSRKNEYFIQCIRFFFKVFVLYSFFSKYSNISIRIILYSIFILSNDIVFEY